MTSPNSLEEQVKARLEGTGRWLATAESCTGGLIAHRITNVAGSSAYFRGGVVSYSNVMKQRLLGVAAETLIAVGAVSEEVALEMVKGCRERFDADYAVSVTGIAGPGGGTAEKPVGLVWMAAATPDDVVSLRCLFEGDRVAIKEQTAERALALLLEQMA